MSEPAIQKALEFENYFTQDEIKRRDYRIRRKAPCFSYGGIRRVHRICVSN